MFKIIIDVFIDEYINVIEVGTPVHWLTNSSRDQLLR